MDVLEGFVETGQRCMFCLRQCGGSETTGLRSTLNFRGVVDHLFSPAKSSNPRSFQQFFWKLLVGNWKWKVEDYPEYDMFGAVSGGEFDKLLLCWSCSKIVFEMKELHSDLEKVQMLLAEKLARIQEVIGDCHHRSKNGGIDIKFFNGRQLSEFQEKVIAEMREGSNKVPLVFLKKLQNFLPAVTLRCKKEEEYVQLPHADLVDTDAKLDFTNSGDADPDPMFSADHETIFAESLTLKPRRKRGRPRKDALTFTGAEKAFESDGNWNMNVTGGDGSQNANQSHPESEDERDDDEHVPGTKTPLALHKVGGPHVGSGNNEDNNRPCPPKKSRSSPKKANFSDEKLKVPQKVRQNSRLVIKKQPPVEPHIRTRHNHTIFYCDICGKSYFKKVSFLKHKLAHESGKTKGASTKVIEDTTGPDDKEKECPVCQDGVQPTEYYAHLLSHEEDAGIVAESRKEFKCNHKDCTCSFNIEENLKVHIDVDHSELNSESLMTVKKCDVCNFCYDTSHDLLAHMKRVHKEMMSTVLYCPICTQSFTISENLIVHMGSHITEQQTCFTCKEKFLNRQELLQHFRDHHNLQTSKECGMCNEKFDDIYEHKTHLITVHKKGEIFICSFCGKRCYFSYAFMRHMSVHKVMDKRKHGCNDCNEVFSNSNKLSHHRVKFHGALKHSCSICGREYMAKSTLEKHMREHRNEGHHCTVCDRHFAFKARYDEHMISHKTEKPFTCELCGSSFKSKRDLGRHYATHDKKLECSICGRKFATNFSLKNHLRMHSGETCMCSYCGYEFHSSRTLHRHLRKYHTGDNPQTLRPLKKLRHFRTKWKDDDGNYVFAKSGVNPGPSHAAQPCEKASLINE